VPGTPRAKQHGERADARAYDPSVRIVSLLPSATEILFELGIGDQVVGVTFECDFPPEARQRRIVSTSALPEHLSPAEIDSVVKQRIAAGEDLYHLDRGAFADIDPEMVVTQDLCAVCAVDVSEVDDALAYLACNADVVTLDPMSLDEVLESIVTVGHATGTAERAASLVNGLRRRLGAVRQTIDGAAPRTVLLLEWTEPAFTAGHWVPDMIDAAGGVSVLSYPRQSSRGVEWDAIGGSDAEIVIVAPCGYRLEGATALAKEVVDRGVLPAGAEVWAVDADAIVVRPGPRVVDGVEVFATIIHPDRAGKPDPALATRIR
jgi:iron complex transport system substrate-binding protein